MCKEKTLFYNTVVKAFSQATKVDIGPRVNGITVKNAGNTILVFDDEQLQPGESKAIGGNKGELLIARKDISFITPTPAPAVITNLAYVTIKFYITLQPYDPNYVNLFE